MFCGYCWVLSTCLTASISSFFIAARQEKPPASRRVAATQRIACHAENRLLYHQLSFQHFRINPLTCPVKEPGGNERPFSFLVVLNQRVQDLGLWLCQSLAIKVRYIISYILNTQSILLIEVDQRRATIIRWATVALLGFFGLAPFFAFAFTLLHVDLALGTACFARWSLSPLLHHQVSVSRFQIVPTPPFDGLLNLRPCLLVSLHFDERIIVSLAPFCRFLGFCRWLYGRRWGSRWFYRRCWGRRWFYRRCWGRRWFCGFLGTWSGSCGSRRWCFGGSRRRLTCSPHQHDYGSEPTRRNAPSQDSTNTHGRYGGRRTLTLMRLLNPGLRP